MKGYTVFNVDQIDELPETYYEVAKPMPETAELGATFLAADFGLSLEPRDGHAAYIAHWLEGLRNDKRFIFQAAAHAQKAVDYLHGLQPNSDEVAA